MTNNTSTVINFAALDQIRAKARTERSKTFWAIWAGARAVIASRLARVAGSAYLIRA
jgi:hypothetical protein